MRAFFMYDNFTFEEIKLDDGRPRVRQVQRLFNEDGCGMLGVKDEYGATLEKLIRHGRELRPGKYGLPLSEIKEWADEVETELAFKKLMA